MPFLLFARVTVGVCPYHTVPLVDHVCLCFQYHLWLYKLPGGISSPYVSLVIDATGSHTAVGLQYFRWVHPSQPEPDDLVVVGKLQSLDNG